MALNAYFNRSFISHFRWSSSELFCTAPDALPNDYCVFAVSHNILQILLSTILFRIPPSFTQCETVEFLFHFSVFLFLFDEYLKVWKLVLDELNFQTLHEFSATQNTDLAVNNTKRWKAITVSLETVRKSSFGKFPKKILQWFSLNGVWKNEMYEKWGGDSST